MLQLLSSWYIVIEFHLEEFRFSIDWWVEFSTDNDEYTEDNDDVYDDDEADKLDKGTEASCGGGVERRDVTCVRADGRSLHPAQCAHAPMPTLVQPCEVPSFLPIDYFFVLKNLRSLIVS